MSHAVSIHIGVNEPGVRSAGDVRARLADSETDAWRMAELASQVGYESIQVLRGAAATQTAVRTVLLEAAQVLQSGDMLFVSFSGHGGQIADENGDDASKYDESWSLHDGELLDDELLVSWRLFRPGVRIMVVSESCYSGGIYRGSNHGTSARHRRRRRRSAYRGEPAWSQVAIDRATASCIASPPCDDYGIQASVLMLAASAENQPAQGGLFTECLLKTWDNAEFHGTYCQLYDRVKQEVQKQNQRQQPQIMMAGTPDLDFPLQPAFRHTSRNASPREPGPPAAPPQETDSSRMDSTPAERDEAAPEGGRRRVIYRERYR